MPVAITYSEYGDADVLELTEVPLPQPGPGEVRVAVKASGVNPIDWKVRRGYMSGGKPLETPLGIGSDAAGVVDAVGPEVTAFSVGDRVAGRELTGTAAQYIVAPVTKLARLADSIDFVTGAAVGVVGSTAIRALSHAKLSAGQTLLLHAATGGAGIFTTQLALSRGITVIGTTSEKNLEFLRGLGAIPVAYGEGWQDRVRAAAPGPIDAAIDAVGGGVAAASLDLLVPGGLVVTIADFSVKDPRVIVTVGGEPGFENSLAESLQLIEDGTVVLPVEKSFPLAEAADAHRLSETGHVRGKIVITVE